MFEDLELYDVTIIGGGPAGMYTAFYSGMRDLKTKVIEFNPELGGRIHYYPEKIIWDVGGLTPVTGAQLMQQLIQQAQTFEPDLVFNQQITGLERLDNGNFILTAATGERHYTKTAILCMGYGVPKMAKLEIEGADRYEVTNLHYTVQELEIFRGRRVVISGGGNSAVDWANALEPIAASVTVVHRREEFGGHERHVAQMRQSRVDVCTLCGIAELHGCGSCIEEVTIAHLETGESIRLPVDDVIVNHGMRADLDALKQWGLEMNEGHVVVDEKMESNIPGIFAAGDLAQYPNKVRLIAGSFTDGINAVNNAKLRIDPKADKVGYVSSHNERFKERNKALGLVGDEQKI
ncbi:NAD(P)/FAD-dependent oxidoreductase [Paenibacillus sp. JX-17]|uniref:Ferredoxin--NADP reductase n=1 Tax=Paenibacillus lacisoli TaxID=3064525 RepID=A0ABT9CC01_9BACL|nr:NAD(P)/FAD-dependent oxidoreductase [Paenibacillus sp. JX-17]MDO7906400.1 NAD(P)/FAD-dependent oxidoreductase [Paenibacillus sp. JX-17]